MVIIIHPAVWKEGSHKRRPSEKPNTTQPIMTFLAALLRLS
jgi:hypothetical protein